MGRSGDAEALRIFGDRLEAGLKLRLTNQPTLMHSLVQTLVLAQTGLTGPVYLADGAFKVKRHLPGE